ncbi:MAG: diacylglycerol kinase family lipid kinase [Clostridia bacterium]|nr:diacylglycerol kinase family lipid kinase [Clostridia bacterium]
MLAIIANPASGRGRGQACLEKTCALLDARGLAYRVMRTEKPGDATLFADEAITQGDGEIVCIGGDGTIYEIVNGIRCRPATMYFVPSGTGNDFVRMLDLPKDPIDALASQLDGEPRCIDVGQVNERFFLNVSGCGFDVEVLRQTVHFKRFGRNLLPYLLGLFSALRLFKPLKVTISLNGETYSGEATIISVGNGRYFGGGMKPTPDASISDGLFDFIRIDAVGKWQILRLLSKFIAGKHTSLPIVHAVRCHEVTIHSPGMTINQDGELVQADTAVYRIWPKALTIKARELK